MGCRCNSVPVQQLSAVNFWTLSNPVIASGAAFNLSWHFCVEKAHLEKKLHWSFFYTCKIDTIISVYILQRIDSCYRVIFPVIERLSTTPLQITLLQVHEGEDPVRNLLLSAVKSSEENIVYDGRLVCAQVRNKGSFCILLLYIWVCVKLIKEILIKQSKKANSHLVKCASTPLFTSHFIPWSCCQNESKVRCFSLVFSPNYCKYTFLFYCYF